MRKWTIYVFLTIFHFLQEDPLHFCVNLMTVYWQQRKKICLEEKKKRWGDTVGNQNLPTWSAWIPLDITSALKNCTVLIYFLKALFFQTDLFPCISKRWTVWKRVLEMYHVSLVCVSFHWATWTLAPCSN